jgi:23S rRNA (uracil1939-C5)-methyltransferase
MPAIAGVVAFREPNPGDQRAAAPEILVFDGEDHLTYQISQAGYRVSAGSFFQTNRHLTGELVKIVTQGRSGDLALDLYAGVGLFSTALAGDFRHIVSVEPSQTSSGDLSYNLPANGKAVRATAEQYLDPGGKTEKTKNAVISQTTGTPDLVVVDPPRNGLEGRVTHALAGLGASRVIYVSCDPATLARDLVPLLGAGYRVEQVHLVDLFPQTFHLESVVHLVR